MLAAGRESYAAATEALDGERGRAVAALANGVALPPEDPLTRLVHPTPPRQQLPILWPNRRPDQSNHPIEAIAATASGRNEPE